MEDVLIKFLSGFVTKNRIQLFNQVLSDRTRYITVVLEDLYQPHNASAVLRTCDCFGIQDVHIIENRNKYTVNPDVALGSSKWLDLVKYNKKDNNTLPAFKKLRKAGYRIVATAPHDNEVTLDEFDLEKGKTALLFGTELNGLTDTAINNADEFLKIHMFGFTESYNISVSVAIVLYHLVNDLKKSNIHWQLSDKEKKSVKLDWLRKSIKMSSYLEKEFLSKNKSP